MTETNPAHVAKQVKSDTRSMSCAGTMNWRVTLSHGHVRFLSRFAVLCGLPRMMPRNTRVRHRRDYPAAGGVKPLSPQSPPDLAHAADPPACIKAALEDGDAAPYPARRDPAGATRLARPGWHKGTARRAI